MISWTIPADVTLTASASETSSSSYGSSSSFQISRTWDYPTQSTSGSGLTLSSASNSNTEQSSYESSYSASTGISGITTARTTRFTSSNSEQGTLYYGFEGGGTAGGPNSNSFSTSSSHTESGTLGYSVCNVATSTTEAYASQATTTQSSVIADTDWEDYGEGETVFNSYWTTSSTGETSRTSVTFFTQNDTTSAVYQTENTTRQATRTVATTLTSTQTAEEKATVVQADATEVLYHIASPATTWNGYLVASEAATTATRVTLYPSYSTAAISVVSNASTTSSEVNTAVTQSLSWKRTTSNAATVTTVNRAYLPNRTGTAASQYATTSTSLAVTVFPAETLNFGSGSSRTVQVTTYGTVPAVVTRQIGSLAYETTVATTISATRRVLVANAVTDSTTYSTQTNGGSTDSIETESYGGTTASGSANSYAGNQTLHGPPQVTFHTPPQIERARYETSGAALGSQSGGWMTYGGVEWYIGGFSIGTDLVSRGTALDGSGSHAVTLFPASFSQFSISGRTITINSSGSTSSYEIGLSGSTSTFQQSDSVSHFGGGPLAEGCTLVEVAGPGAYKDRAGNGTTSFNGAATVLTQGQSAPIRVWQTVQNIGPLELRSARHGLTFTEARNSVALPAA